MRGEPGLLAAHERRELHEQLGALAEVRDREAGALRGGAVSAVTGTAVVLVVSGRRTLAAGCDGANQSERKESAGHREDSSGGAVEVDAGAPCPEPQIDEREVGVERRAVGVDELEDAHLSAAVRRFRRAKERGRIGGSALALAGGCTREPRRLGVQARDLGAGRFERQHQPGTRSAAPRVAAKPLVLFTREQGDGIVIATAKPVPRPDPASTDLSPPPSSTSGTSQRPAARASSSAAPCIELQRLQVRAGGEAIDERREWRRRAVREVPPDLEGVDGSAAPASAASRARARANAPASRSSRPSAVSSLALDPAAVVPGDVAARRAGA